MKITKLIISFLILVSTMSFFLKNTFASNDVDLINTKQVKEINSFEVFWPLVAGKTYKDGFIYKLKIFKENLRLITILGPIKKADQYIFLSAKRMLEAEKLLSESEKEFAQKNLEESLSNLQKAKTNLSKNRENINFNNELKNQTLSRLDGISSLAQWLNYKSNEEIIIFENITKESLEIKSLFD